MFPCASLKIELLAFITIFMYTLAEGLNLKYLKLVQSQYKCIKQLQKQVLGILRVSH